MKKKLNLNEELVKSEQEEQQLEPHIVENKTPSFTNKTYGIVEKNRDYLLIEVGYDLETGDTSPIKIVGSYSSREEAQERFKIAVVVNEAF